MDDRRENARGHIVRRGRECVIRARGRGGRYWWGKGQGTARYSHYFQSELASDSNTRRGGRPKCWWRGSRNSDFLSWSGRQRRHYLVNEYHSPRVHRRLSPPSSVSSPRSVSQASWPLPVGHCDGDLISTLKTGDFGRTIYILELFKDEEDSTPFTQTGLNTALLEACRQGQKYVVQLLLHAGANVYATDDDRNTALMIAAEKGFVDIAKLLIRRGANVHAVNSSLNSVLLTAIRPQGSTDMVNLLISRRAYVDAQNREGKTALMKAIEYKDFDVIKILLDAGCKMNQATNRLATTAGISHVINLLKEEKKGKKKNKSKATALMKASSTLDVEAVRVLLDCQHTNVNKSSNDGTALMQIVRSLCKGSSNSRAQAQKLEIMKLLLQGGAWIDEKQSREGSALILATKAGHTEIVRLLCEQRARLDSLHGNRTALMIAAELGREDLVQLLLDFGAEVDVKNSFAEDALLMALKHGRVECAKLLLSSGASLDGERAAKAAVEHRQLASLEFLADRFSIDVNKDCLLHKAVMLNREDMVKVLLKMGADVNKLNDNKALPLTLACPVGESMVRLLLEEDADVNSNASMTGPPLLLSISCSISVTRLLLEKGAEVNMANSKGKTALMKACDRYGDSRETVELLLSAGADPNLRNKKGETALHIATAAENIANVRKLIEVGVDMEARTNTNNETAYLYAADSGNVEIIKLFQARGADVNVEDSSGCNAVMRAVKNLFGANITAGVVKLLSPNTEHVNKQCKEGFTPLMMAAEESSVEITKALLELGADVNIVNSIEPLYKCTTALSILLGNSTSYKKSDVICIEELIKHGALNSLPQRCSSILHKMIILDKRRLIPVLVTNGMTPCTADLRPVMYRLGPYLQMQMLRFTMNEASPLSAALASGNVHIARYLAGNWFLTRSDITGLARHNNLRDYLAVMDMRECVQFVEEFIAQPMSLLKLSFITVSDALGGPQGREARVQKIPLPAVMKDKLLFKREDVTLDLPSDDAGMWSEDTDYDDDDDDDNDDDDSDGHNIFLDVNDEPNLYYDSESDRYLYYDNGAGVYDSDDYDGFAF